jgi:hypothetical protein
MGREESLEALVVRVQGENPDCHWVMYGRNLGYPTQELYLVLVGLDRKNRTYEIGKRYELESKTQGMRLIALSSGCRKSAKAVM